MTSNAKDGKTSFFVGGPIDPVRHFHVDRERYIKSIAKAFESNYFLLHAHQQAGKSSLIKPIICALTEKFPNSITISVNLHGLEENNFWESLWQRMNSACGKLMLTKFSSISEFLDAFDSEKFFGSRVYLIIDGIDQLLHLPLCHERFFSVLRSIRTSNTTTETRPYAIHGFLGLGAYHVNKLICLSGSNFPLFKFATIIRLPQPQLQDVVQMFSKYGNMIYRNMISYAEDIFGRTGGHLGLVSAFGRTLHLWIDSFNPGNQDAITIEAWIGQICLPKPKGQVIGSHIIDSITQCSSIENDLITISRQILFCLMTNNDVIRDPSQQSQLHRDAVDYLEAIGAVVRGSVELIRFSAPLLRTVLFDYFWERMDKESILPDLDLPMIQIGDYKTLDMIGCIQQTLALFNRKISHPLELNDSNVVPAFHYQLHCMLSHLTSRVNRINWNTASEVRSSAGNSGIRKNVYVTNNGRQRYGFEILSESNRGILRENLFEHIFGKSKRTTRYKKEMGLTKILIINVCTVLQQPREEYMFTTTDPDISIVHVHIPLVGSHSTILRSMNIEHDITVDMLETNICYESIHKIDNVAIDQSIVPIVYIDQPTDTMVVVGDTSFDQGSYPKMSDFLKSVDDEVVLNNDDLVRLRLYSKKRKTYVAAATETHIAFSKFQIDDLEIRCGRSTFPLTKH